MRRGDRQTRDSGRLGGLARTAIALLLVARPAQAGPTGAGPEETPAAPLGSGPFLVTTESAVNQSDFGLVMSCPAHEHGPPERAEQLLREILAGRPRGVPSTLWVCRIDQEVTLARFAPLVDRVVVDPFAPVAFERAGGGRRGGSGGSWSGGEHPVLSRLAKLREIAGARDLLACVDLGGESAFFRSRRIDIDELQWLVCAVVGSRYQGLVWRGTLADESAQRRLRTLENRLLEHAADLGAARPAAVLDGPPETLVSALWAPDKAFLVALSTAYLRPYEPGRTVELPLSDPKVEGAAELRPPAGAAVESASTLEGIAVAVEQAEGRIRVPLRFRGFGQILVLQTAPRSPAGQRSEPAPGDGAAGKAVAP